MNSSPDRAENLAAVYSILLIAGLKRPRLLRDIRKAKRRGTNRSYG
jgi:hypothetical protein